MKHFLLLTFAILNMQAYGLTQADVAQLYGDLLLEQFDQELDQKIAMGDNQSMMSSLVYAKLLSSRSFSDHHAHKKIYLPEVIDAGFYKQVIAEIDAIAEDIHLRLQSEIPSDGPVIFPHNGAAGNIHGNRFPPGYWALTFDDGPKKGRTEAIVDTLYNNGLKATFFMVMEKVQEFPQSAQYVLDAGFELALHSYTHENLSKANSAVLHKEITVAKRDIESALDRKITFFRLPYGAGLRKSEVRNLITKNQMIHVFWNVDSLDWKDKNPASILKRVQKQMALARNQGGVILFHDIHNQTVAATTLLMDHIHQQSLQTCFLADFMNYLNGQKQDCVK